LTGTEANSMEDVSLHVLDIVQNSIAAEASRIVIFIQDRPEQDRLEIRICDNGKGMDPDQVKSVSDPFYTTRTTRRVGLGIPLLQASAEATGGYLKIRSEKGTGTVVQAVFHSKHIDCPPMGRMEDTMAVLICCNPDVQFHYSHIFSDRKFVLHSGEIQQKLGEISIAYPDVIMWIKDYIHSGLEEIYGGVGG